MAIMPFPLTGTDLYDVRFQVWELIRQVYEEKIGGADLGDVFSIPGDVLTLNIGTNGGLKKSSNNLIVDAYATGGLQTNSNGLSIKVVSTGGLETTASGTGIKLDGTTLTLSASGLKVTTSNDYYSVVTHNTDTVLANSDLGKIHVMDVSGGDREFTLPATDVSHVGYWVGLIRNGTANDLIINAGAVADVINNSSGGGYIICTDASHNYSSLFLIQAAVGHWTEPSFGIWTTY